MYVYIYIIYNLYHYIYVYNDEDCLNLYYNVSRCKKKRGQILYLIILTIFYAKEGCQCQNYAPGISQKARLVKKYHRCA